MSSRQAGTSSFTCTPVKRSSLSHKLKHALVMEFIALWPQNEKYTLVIVRSHVKAFKICLSRFITTAHCRQLKPYMHTNHQKPSSEPGESYGTSNIAKFQH
uniref:Uncharacterized protein n=1 Tax=Opuntia streptacantha TaxID=393608 RepID=A0A7C9DMY9_OPUST